MCGRNDSDAHDRDCGRYGWSSERIDGWTNKFIFPPYDFSVANSMVTNFHLPLSTLLMLVAAYGGYDLVMEAYHTALKEDYRFGTYGDAMLIWISNTGWSSV